ncbi:transporter [Sphingomonas sp.]|uniref:transporter n=1 Tax=Sphingomonas sp. TaxID=28214 RepID=UPI00286B0E97|nr:transporter [Sphingomonas sp.]
MAQAMLLAAEVATAPICAERPGKANAVCTVPAGKWQLETGIADWSLTRQAGTRDAVLILGSSFLKLGLSDTADLEVGVTPFVQATIKQAGSRSRVSGFGDVVVRYKHQLTDKDADLQVAAIPFVKVPTAAHAIGNGKVEGGLAVPVGLALGGPVTVTFGPEVDVLADADGSGRHFGLTNLVSLSVAVAPRVTVGGELWGNWNLDPAGTVKQASADAAIAYAASNALQLDLGANVGLNRQTPDIELYAGASILF